MQTAVIDVRVERATKRRAFVVGEALGEQVDVPQPQEVDGVVMVGDAVHASDVKGVRISERASGLTQRGHVDRGGAQLIERDGVGKHVGVRNSPMQVDAPRLIERPWLRVVALRRGQRERWLDVAAPSSVDQHSIGCVDRFGTYQQIGIDAWTKMRCAVNGIREAGALHQERIDPLRAQCGQQAVQFAFTDGVERRCGSQFGGERGARVGGEIAGCEQQVDAVPPGGCENVTQDDVGPASPGQAPSNFLYVASEHDRPSLSDRVNKTSASPNRSTTRLPRMAEIAHGNRIAGRTSNCLSHAVLYATCLSFRQRVAVIAGPRCTLSRILSTAIIAGIVAASTAPGQAQGPQRRRGGPRDWSQGRLVATRFGPDGDGSIGRNWRTRLKHHQIETARQRRAPRPILDFFEALGERLGARRLPPGDAGVDWNLRTGGTGSVIGSPAKYNFDIDAANCSDVIYFTVDHAGRPSRVNVIAITNPYVGCPGNPANLTPTVKFGLRLPHGVPTSPVPSLDGEVLYVIESRPSVNGGMILHAINVDNITTNVGTYNYTTTRWSSAHALAAPSGAPDSEQLFQLTLAGVTNTLSSPYLDYESNQIFFGDSQGRIHRVTNVHTAAAARDTTNFPVQCGTQALHSPVFVNGQVFVSGTSGRLYRIDMNGPGPYTCVGAHQGGTGASIGGAHSPVLVDVSNNKILLITNDSEQNGVREIAAYDLDFANNDQPTSVSYLGAASTSIIPVTPTLDDQFWSTNDGSIYGVGAPASGAATQLWRIPYNGELGGPPAATRT